jgi:hypothetical protein
MAPVRSSKKKPGPWDLSLPGTSVEVAPSSKEAKIPAVRRRASARPSAVP